MSYHTFYPILTDGLVFYLDPMNNKSYSGSGTASYDLVSKSVSYLNNGVSFDSRFFLFDGVNDDMDSGLVNITAGSDLTIEICLKIGNMQVPYADIFDYDHVGGGFVLQQFFPSSVDNWYFAWFNGTFYEFIYMTLPIDEYFYLTITKSGGNFDIYKNGTFLSNGSGNSSITASGKRLFISNLVGGGRNFFGDISSLRMYNRSLTPTEILNNYESTKNRFLNL